MMQKLNWLVKAFYVLLETKFYMMADINYAQYLEDSVNDFIKDKELPLDYKEQITFAIFTAGARLAKEFNREEILKWMDKSHKEIAKKKSKIDFGWIMIFIIGALVIFQFYCLLTGRRIP